AVSGAVCVVLLGVMLSMQYQAQRQLDQLLALYNQQQAKLALLAVVANQKPIAPLSNNSVSTPSTPLAATDSLPVAYGEVPLAGARLERLRDLVTTARNEQRKVVIRIETFMADFCLSLLASGSYVAASDEALLSSCDLVGNPFGDALNVSQRQSLAFANLLNSINQESSGDVKVQLVDGGHQMLVAYPERSATLRAGEWNHVAERNQRVEFSVQLIQ
ncbi:MAG: hypothetical protein AB7U99_02240, partial [Steroidobacteraceae bacterium]